MNTLAKGEEACSINSKADAVSPVRRADLLQHAIAKSEQWYFKHLQTLREYSVKVEPRHFGRENAFELNKRIGNVLKDGGFAIAMFDADVSQYNDKERQRVEQMKRKYANNKNVLFCDSLPSIEYWFLLHYADVGRLFSTCDEVVRELRKHVAAFDKCEDFLEKETWVRELCQGKRLDEAIKRAKLQENKVKMGENVSYSNVYKALELLEKRKVQASSR